MHFYPRKTQSLVAAHLARVAGIKVCKVRTDFRLHQTPYFPVHELKRPILLCIVITFGDLNCDPGGIDFISNQYNLKCFEILGSVDMQMCGDRYAA